MAPRREPCGRMLYFSNVRLQRYYQFLCDLGMFSTFAGFAFDLSVLKFGCLG